MQSHGLDIFTSRYGSPSAYLLVFGLGFAVLALMMGECVVKRHVAAKFLRILFYREDDRLSYPVPALGFIWSSLAAYLLLGNYFGWHSNFDNALLRIAGLALGIHLVLQLVLYVRHELLSPVSEVLDEPEDTEEDIIGAAVEEQLERRDELIALFKKERVPLDEPHTIEVHFIAPDKASAERLVVALKENRFRVEPLSEPPAGFDTWSVTAIHYTSIQEMVTAESVERFVRIARKCGCQHDGWGMPLHRIDVSSSVQ